MIVSEEEYNSLIERIKSIVDEVYKHRAISTQYKIKTGAINILNKLLLKRYWLADDFAKEIGMDSDDYDYKALYVLIDADILIIKRALVGIIYMFNPKWRLTKSND